MFSLMISLTLFPLPVIVIAGFGNLPGDMVCYSAPAKFVLGDNLDTENE
jgi:hypothetical protein